MEIALEWNLLDSDGELLPIFSGVRRGRGSCDPFERAFETFPCPQSYWSVMGNPKGHTSMDVSELDSHSSSDGESTPVEGCLDSIPDPENGRGYDLRSEPEAARPDETACPDIQRGDRPNDPRPPAKREAVSSGNGSPLIKIRRTESAGSSSRIGTISIPEHRKRAPGNGNGQSVAGQLSPRGDRTDGNNPANLLPDVPRAPAPPRSNLQGIPLWLRRLLDQYGNQPIIPVLVEIPTRPTQAPGNGNGERVVDQLFPNGNPIDGNNPANPVPAIPRVPAPPCGHGQDIPDCLRRLLNQQGNQPRTPSHAENPTRPTQDRVAPVDSGRTVDLDINSYDDGEFYSEFKDRNENEEDNDDDDDDN